ALGAEPYLDRGRLHTETIPFQLDAIAEVPLARFITTESPLAEQITSDTKRQLAQQIASVAQTGTNVSIRHVGALYVMLYWLMQPDDKTKGPWPNFPTESPLPSGKHLLPSDFTGLDSKRQSEESEWSSGDPALIIRAIRSAKPNAADGPLKAVYEIALQGEG